MTSSGVDGEGAALPPPAGEKVKRTVLKFGGTSCGSAERLQQVCDIVHAKSKQGPLAVVVSAPGDATDWLIEAVNLAAQGKLEEADEWIDRIIDAQNANILLVLRAFNKSLPQTHPMIRKLVAPVRQLLLGVSLLREQTKQTLDLVLSFGERISACTVAELLKGIYNFKAEYIDARRFMVTDSNFGEARVDWPTTLQRFKEMECEWDEHTIPIITGFIGQTVDGQTTTLGRNGSDYTATLIARALDAKEVNIMTDVPGVFTADPRIVRDAYPVERLSYQEAVELAIYGTRMFHTRTMLPLIESKIPMRISHTMQQNLPGTIIDELGLQHDGRPTCITSLENLALVNMRLRNASQGRANLGHRLVRVLDVAGIPIWMALQAAHGQSVSVVIPQDRVAAANAVITEEFALDISRKEVEVGSVKHPVTLLSLIAEGIRESNGIVSHFFKSLESVGIRILAIAQGNSSRSISCVIMGEDTNNAVITAHSAFNFSQLVVHLAVVGAGFLGKDLLRHLQQQQQKLMDNLGVRVRVVAFGEPGKLFFNPRGHCIQTLLGSEGPYPDACELTDQQLWPRMRNLTLPVLIDCTTTGEMANLYVPAFEHGLHIFSGNRHALTGPMAQYRTIVDTAQRLNRAFFYETTVGASLPVFDTLKSMLHGGDEVHRISASLSTSLGALCCDVMEGVPLKQAVEGILVSGLTEQCCMADLSGMDCARKALLLARELGFPLELKDVKVTPLVPGLDNPDFQLDDMWGVLEKHEKEMGVRADRLRVEGKALRYLCHLRITNGEDGTPRVLHVSVGPEEVDKSHFAYRLKSGEVYLSFFTEKFKDLPFTVQGAGVPSLLASGILTSVILFCSHAKYH